MAWKSGMETGFSAVRVAESSVVAVGGAGFEAGAGHPHGKPSGLWSRPVPSGDGDAAELGAQTTRVWSRRPRV